MTIKVTLSGAMGRMGRRVGAELNAMDGVMFVCGLVRGSCVSTKECLAPLTDDALAAVRSCDVLMDFTNIDSTLKLARICAELKRPIFVGTTTRRAKDIEMLKEIATDIPVLYAPNITRGAAALFGVLQELAQHGCTFALGMVPKGFVEFRRISFDRCENKTGSQFACRAASHPVRNSEDDV